MQRYRVIVRHGSQREDVALANRHIAVLKSEIDYVGTSKSGKPIVRKSGQAVFRMDIPCSEPQRDGEISILVATPAEQKADPNFNDYVLA